MYSEKCRQIAGRGVFIKSAKNSLFVNVFAVCRYVEQEGRMDDFFWFESEGLTSLVRVSSQRRACEELLDVFGDGRFRAYFSVFVLRFFFMSSVIHDSSKNATGY